MDPFVVWTLAPVGVVVGLFLWVHPKVLVVATLLSVLFVRTLTHLSGFAIVANLDDALTVMTAIRCAQIAVSERKGPSGRLPGQLTFLAFAACGVLPGLILRDVEPGTLMQGTYLACKGLILGWACSKIAWTEKDIRSAVRLGAGVAIFILVSAVLNATSPVNWAHVFSVDGKTINRYGLPSITGVFIHPFDFAFFFALITAGALAYQRHFGLNRRTVLFTLACIAATLASLRRKDTIAIVFATAQASLRYRWWPALIALVIALPIFVIVAFNGIATQVDSLTTSYLSVSSPEARTVLTLGAVQVANDYAPFGAGFGRYASETAAQNYSPEYSRLGFETVYGLRPSETFFATDTSWPAIFGEAGWLGGALFCLGLATIMLHFIRIERTATLRETRWVAAVGLIFLPTLLIQSLGAPVFSSPPGYPWLFAIAGVASSMRAREKFSSVNAAMERVGSSR